jgi:hypothetical protein
MRAKPFSAALLVLCSSLFLAFGEARAHAGDMKLEIQLVWGTNDAGTKKHQPVEDEVLRKLRELPLKWTNYFLVNSLQLTLPESQTKKEALSDKCSIELTNLGHSQVQISLYGKGEHVVKRTQQLVKGEIVVLGGNAPNSTAWLIVIKRLE